MKVYRADSEIIKAKNAVVTVGSFDGLHIGHFKILNKVKEFANQKNGSSFVVTFEPHPRSVVSKDFDLKILTTLDEKIEILEKAGIENLVVIDFTKEFSQQTSDQFIGNWLVGKVGTAHMVIGHDHRFGKDRLGDVQKLKEIGKLYNFDVSEVSPMTVNGEIVSSTAIRNALTEGNMEKANYFLGRNYIISGIVVPGVQRGRQLGFPTANIQPDDSKKAIPVNGIYFVGCIVDDEKHFGIMNIGFRPTFERGHKLVLEVYILNFDRDIYGKKFKISFMKRLREERKFESREALISQMELDKKIALEMVAKNEVLF